MTLSGPAQTDVKIHDTHASIPGRAEGSRICHGGAWWVSVAEDRPGCVAGQGPLLVLDKHLYVQQL